MSIYTGSTEISKVYSGSTEVKQVYQGSNLVWFSELLNTTVTSSSWNTSPTIYGYRSAARGGPNGSIGNNLLVNGYTVEEISGYNFSGIENDIVFYLGNSPPSDAFTELVMADGTVLSRASAQSPNGTVSGSLRGWRFEDVWTTSLIPASGTWDFLVK